MRAEKEFAKKQQEMQDINDASFASCTEQDLTELYETMNTLDQKKQEVILMQRRCLVDKRIYLKWLSTMRNIEDKIMRAQR